jgi:hypothetical protein
MRCATCASTWTASRWLPEIVQTRHRRRGVRRALLLAGPGGGPLDPLPQAADIGPTAESAGAQPG